MPEASAVLLERLLIGVWSPAVLAVERALDAVTLEVCGCLRMIRGRARVNKGLDQDLHTVEPEADLQLTPMRTA